MREPSMGNVAALQARIAELQAQLAAARSALEAAYGNVTACWNAVELGTPLELRLHETAVAINAALASIR